MQIQDLYILKDVWLRIKVFPCSNALMQDSSRSSFGLTYPSRSIPTEIEEFAEEIDYLLDAISKALASEVSKLRGVERLDVSITTTIRRIQMAVFLPSSCI